MGDSHHEPAARRRRGLHRDATAIAPQITWGTSPEHVIPVDGLIPDPDLETDAARRDARKAALEYIEWDEYVEVTPQVIRLRKTMLTETERKRQSRSKGG